MAEVTTKMIYELLMPMQDQLSDIERKLTLIDGRIDVLAEQVADVRVSARGLHGDITNINEILGRLDQRVTRIEKRLDIIEEPAE